MLSIFGNVHCTLKALPNIITNSGHHPYFFPVQFPPFYCHFSFAKVPISIFGSAYWTLETVPNVVTNSEHHHQAHQCALQPCPIYESDHNRCTKMTSFLKADTTNFSNGWPRQTYANKTLQNAHLRYFLASPALLCI